MKFNELSSAVKAELQRCFSIEREKKDVGRVFGGLRAETGVSVKSRRLKDSVQLVLQKNGIGFVRGAYVTSGLMSSEVDFVIDASLEGDELVPSDKAKGILNCTYRKNLSSNLSAKLMKSGVDALVAKTDYALLVYGSEKGIACKSVRPTLDFIKVLDRSVSLKAERLRRQRN